MSADIFPILFQSVFSPGPGELETPSSRRSRRMHQPLRPIPHRQQSSLKPKEVFPGRGDSNRLTLPERFNKKNLTDFHEFIQHNQLTNPKSF
jgi:hypothetical protein